MAKRLSLLAATLCMGAWAQAQNPYLPLWEYIPDGEPYVFEDPVNPGTQRVYIYGSHDTRRHDYCGREQVVWSAPVEDLSQWRYDGVTLCVTRDRDGNLLRPHADGDVLFAPDVAMKTLPDGTKEYYLYPNNQEGGRNGMVAKSLRPDGPFEIINWSKTNPRECDGVFRFDPGVFVDDDGRVYAYWGFDQSFAGELDPATMATLKPGTEVITNLVSSHNQPGDFRFFEASSMRKIKDKYVLIYSRWTGNGEFGLGESNYTLGYAYSNNPLGPFTYGGTLVDGRGRDTDPDGNVIVTAAPNSNTHGSICQINGQWYVFYHRICGLDEYSRQATVAPISIDVKEGPDGYVRISEAEITSQGFALQGLDPLRRYSAGIACWFTGPRPATPGNYSGPYIVPFRADDFEKFPNPYDLRVSHNDVVHITHGSIVGYKYFNCDALKAGDKYALSLGITPEMADGTIDVYIDSPWAKKGGKKIGTAKISTAKKVDAAHADPNQIGEAQMTIALRDAGKLQGKHALFLVFSSAKKDVSMCRLHTLEFVKQ